jgi:glycerol-3-phosphate acyltransferase PlsY
VTALLFGRTAAAAGVTAIGAVLGHNFPFWHRFKGGKGVAVTCSGVVLMLPGWGFAALIAGAAAVILTRYLCVGAVVIPAVFVAPAALTAGTAAGWIAVYMTALAVMANWKSFVNIRRGEEKQVDVVGLIREKVKKK